MIAEASHSFVDFAHGAMSETHTSLLSGYIQDSVDEGDSLDAGTDRIWWMGGVDPLPELVLQDRPTQRCMAGADTRFS